jgi:hypothetical protein
MLYMEPWSLWMWYEISLYNLNCRLPIVSPPEGSPRIRPCPAHSRSSHPASPRRPLLPYGSQQRWHYHHHPPIATPTTCDDNDATIFIHQLAPCAPHRIYRWWRPRRIPRLLLSMHNHAFSVVVGWDRTLMDEWTSAHQEKPVDQPTPNPTYPIWPPECLPSDLVMHVVLPTIRVRLATLPWILHGTTSHMPPPPRKCVSNFLVKIK